MKNMNGNSLQKKLLELSHNRSRAWLLLEALMIIMAGALASYMHFRLKVPLNIPGHHGLEFMAIFTLIRLSSKLKYAATIATLGTGFILLMPGMGASMPLHSVGYLIPGLLLDGIFQFHTGRYGRLIFIALAAGISYMGIPLSRLIIYLMSGYPYMAFIKHGIAYTIMSFFFFGMMGGVLGFMLNSVRQSFKKE